MQYPADLEFPIVDPNFLTIWKENGGMAPFDRRRSWWVGHKDEFARELAP